MKIVTANRIDDGVPVYRTEDGGWTETFADAAIYEDDVANDMLADAVADDTKVVGPYLVVIDGPGVPTHREAMRENIRAAGPTIHPQFARKQNVRSGQ
jgi:hypothetical protein